MTTTKTLALAAALGTGYLAWTQRRRVPPLQLRNKVVLITGGSRGLGLQLAREFGARGSIVAICARDADELQRAVQDLRDRNIRVHSFVCDIADAESIPDMVAAVGAQCGPIDILVNNAGVIQVGPAADLHTADFERAMDVIFWGTLRTTHAVLPSMRRRGEGSIVNIASIGGKISVPHLLPYACAKFATLAFSEGLRNELSPEGIHVTTIVPGLMRTGSHLRAEFKGQQRAEYAWFGAGAATPLISIGAERAARSIVDATVRRQGEKILSVPADIAGRLHDVMPELSGAVLTLVNRLLPAPGGADFPMRTGAQMEAGTGPLWKLLTRPGQAAAEQLNQL